MLKSAKNYRITAALKNYSSDSALIKEKSDVLQLFELKLTDYQQNLFFACGGSSLWLEQIVPHAYVFWASMCSRKLSI